MSAQQLDPILLRDVYQALGKLVANTQIIEDSPAAVGPQVIPAIIPQTERQTFTNEPKRPTKPAPPKKPLMTAKAPQPPKTPPPMTLAKMNPCPMTSPSSAKDQGPLPEGTMPALSHESLSQVSRKGESRKGQSKGKKQSKEQGQGKGKTQSQWQQGEEEEPPPIKSMTLKELARLAQVGYEFEEFKRAKSQEAYVPGGAPTPKTSPTTSHNYPKRPLSPPTYPPPPAGSPWPPPRHPPPQAGPSQEPGRELSRSNKRQRIPSWYYAGPFPPEDPRADLQDEPTMNEDPGWDLQDEPTMNEDPGADLQDEDPGADLHDHHINF